MKKLFIILFVITLAIKLGHLNCIAQECNIVYVTPNGATSGVAGTKATPAELLYGFTLASATNNKIYMASGTYILFNPLNMLNDVTLEGGFDAFTWEKSNSTTTTIYRDLSNVESSPNRLVAIYCIGISNFRMQDLTIRSANAFGNGTSSYGLYLSNCSDYNIVRCKIIAGNAGNGDNGANGTNGTGGTYGTAGEDGDEQGPCCTAGGIGASGSFPGSNGGGNGGNGGEQSSSGCSLCGNPSDATNGYPGQNGFGTGGGIGGNGGYKIVVCVYPVSCERAPINDGAPGVDGADGLTGIPGTAGTGVHAGGFYIPGNGTAGTTGTHAAGGGGGGGGGSLGGIPYDCLFGLPPNWNGAGAGGGGGGEGGERALGGLGAKGGGSSFAVYINANGANGIIRDCWYSSGSAGLGGLGGGGGTGGPGGAGGAGGGQSNCSIGAGGDGGNGGKGGDGGAGGKGDNGVSYGLYEDISGTPVGLMNINGLQQPFVFVRYSGYTYAPVVFSTTATGTIDWYFGAGAVPSTGSGSPSTTYYATTGRKTFTLVNNGIPYTYSQFIEIYVDGNGLNPTVISVSDSICEGGTGNFISSVAANNYMWIIEGGTSPDTVSGPGLQSLTYAFDTAGTYEVILKTTNLCAGISFPDTFTVNVEPILQPSVTIQASETSNTVCDGATITFNAIASGAGSPPGYQWLVNGVAAGANSSTFSTSMLSDGDVVSCVVISSLSCSTGIVDTSNSITITVIGIPTVSCTVDSSATGEPVYFSATVTSGGLPPFSYLWNFGDSLMGSGDSVAHIYTSSGTYTAQIEVIDANGCSGICTNFVTISSKLTAGFTASIFNGCAPLQVDFINSSTDAITYLWEFGDGSTSVLENPTYIYTNPGAYTVTLNAYGGLGGDSASVTNQVLVLPAPTANFQAYPPIVELGDTIFFADNSSDAWQWQWDFGDGNTDTVQNPTHVYSSTGSYPVTLIATNAYGCTDTIQKPSFITIVPEDTGGVSINQYSIPHMRDNQLKVYPNPFTSELNIEIDLPEKGYLEVSLWNIQGQKIMEIEKIEAVSGIHHIRYSFSESKLTTGLYFLEINYNGQVYYRKVIYNNL